MRISASPCELGAHFVVGLKLRSRLFPWGRKLVPHENRAGQTGLGRSLELFVLHLFDRHESCQIQPWSACESLDRVSLVRVA